MVFGYFAAVLVSLIAFSTSVDAQIGTLLPRVDALTDGQAFLPALEELIQKSNFEQACESSRQVWQLDADPAGECGHVCTDECGGRCCQADVSEFVTEQIWEDTDSLVATLPRCDWEEMDEQPGVAKADASSTDQYCRQMAGLLAVTLNGSHANPEAQRRALEAALKMVAENAQIQAEARIAKLELKFEKSLARFQHEMDRMNSNDEFGDELKAWLSSIHVNQSRNSEQISKLAASNASLNQSIGLLERKIANLGPEKSNYEPPALRLGQPQTVKNRYAEFAKAQFEQAAYEQAEALEIENLRKQIATLDQQLERLAKPIRRAEHLAPIFRPDQPLEPLPARYSR
jgi:hypothetical protein